MATGMQINLPDELVSEAQQFVEDGWAADLNALITDALRRYLESHGSNLSESFIREDIAWGIHGRT